MTASLQVGVMRLGRFFALRLGRGFSVGFLGVPEVK